MPKLQIQQCPYCEDDNARIMETHRGGFSREPQREGYHVTCFNCGAKGGTCRNEANAIAAWNEVAGKHFGKQLTPVQEKVITEDLQFFQGCVSRMTTELMNHYAPSAPERTNVKDAPDAAKVIGAAAVKHAEEMVRARHKLMQTLYGVKLPSTLKLTPDIEPGAITVTVPTDSLLPPRPPAHA